MHGGGASAVIFVALLSSQLAIAQERIQLVGVGTSTALALYSKWFRTFESVHPDVHFSYLPSGSRTGIDMVSSGMADFGGTDVPLNEREAIRVKVFQFATLLAAIVPVYNVPGVTQSLKFSPQALAGIYLGTVTRWDDPLISETNPDVPLPSNPITVIHTSEGRGSTFIWSDYLSRISPAWKNRVGRGLAVAWPVGREADGNSNVARTIKSTPNSIGYVQVVYALQNQLRCGAVRNAAGNFVRPDPFTLQAAAAGSVRSRTALRESITNSPGARSYPIASFTWILVPEKTESPLKRAALKDFLRWALTDGQTYAEEDGFTKLPRALVEQGLKEIEEMP
jgi:phosphate transport system substrate-binding protein